MARRSRAPILALSAEPDAGAGDRAGRTRAADERADHVPQSRLRRKAEAPRNRRRDPSRRANRQRAIEPDRDAAISEAVQARRRSESQLGWRDTARGTFALLRTKSRLPQPATLFHLDLILHGHVPAPISIDAVVAG